MEFLPDGRLKIELRSDQRIVRLDDGRILILTVTPALQDGIMVQEVTGTQYLTIINNANDTEPMELSESEEETEEAEEVAVQPVRKKENTANQPKVVVSNETLAQQLRDGTIKLAMYRGQHVLVGSMTNGKAEIIGNARVLPPDGAQAEVQVPPIFKANLSNLNKDVMLTLQSYLNMRDLKSLSQTTKNLFELTKEEIVDRTKVCITSYDIGTNFVSLLRNYSTCEILVDDPHLRSHIYWTHFLNTSFSETKTLDLKCGSYKLMDLCLNLNNFQNLSSLTIHKIELITTEMQSDFDLSRLENLEVTYSKNFPASFLASCTKLQYLTLGMNENFEVKGIIQQQKCLKNLVVFERNHKWSFLNEEFQVQFQLEKFALFEVTLQYLHLENLLKFLGKQKQLRSVAISFVQEAILANSEILIDSLEEHLSIIDKLNEKDLEGASDAEHCLNLLYFYDNRDNFEMYLDGSLIERMLLELHRLFPRVRNLSLNNASNYKKEYSKVLATMPNKWKSLKTLNFMEFSVVYFLTLCKLPPSCTFVRLKFLGSVFNCDAWKIFIRDNPQLEHIHLILVEPILNDILNQTLDTLLLLPLLERLDICCLDMTGTHIEWIVENLIGLATLQIHNVLFEEVLEEIEDLANDFGVDILEDDFTGNFMDFLELDEENSGACPL